ncbi:MAG: DNA double-strand break repair nuclease NurA [Nitrososphaerota archaeon]|nr:DNA double-strand break repair nuclease NurA [Nitrososphaerota archaeon]
MEVAPPDKEIVAVDGSRGIRPYASGAVFYVARALAITRGKSFRTLEVDAFMSKGKSTDIQTFITRKMEWSEFAAAIKAIQEGNISNAAVLIDGSLFGRMVHLPRDSPAEGMRGFMVEYFETFNELLSLCKEREILLLGVSKDSRSSFLRDYLLNEILEKELKSIGIPEATKLEIVRLLPDVFDRPEWAFASLKRLKGEHGDALRKVELIFWEAFSARTDHQLIRSFVDSPGHTIPIELSLSRRSYVLMKEIQEGPEGYVSRHFKEALLEASDPEAFTRRAKEVLTEIPGFPAMVSFHVMLDRRDTPVRVDTPSWTFNRDTTISDFSGGRDLLVNVNPFVSLLLSGYGGLKDYNVWLKRVDEKVKLTNEVVDKIYEAALQRELGFTIIHSRGYRRVKYP